MINENIFSAALNCIHLVAVNLDILMYLLTICMFFSFAQLFLLSYMLLLGTYFCLCQQILNFVIYQETFPSLSLSVLLLLGWLLGWFKLIFGLKFIYTIFGLPLYSFHNLLFKFYLQLFFLSLKAQKRFPLSYINTY